MLYQRADALDFSLADLRALPRPGRVVLTTPDHFDVRYVINPHMAGQIGTVDRSRAAEQWRTLRETYESLGFQPLVVQGAPDQPDMVFCANQTFPYLRPDGTRGVLMSRMDAPERQGEVAHYAHFFQNLGFETLSLPSALQGSFEGMGDALWHPGRALVWGGHGFRTDPAVYSFLAEQLDVPVLRLQLTDPEFYHLDTCLSLLDEESALYVPAAFDDEGRALIRRLLPRLIEVPEEEARQQLACNAHCPDGRHVLLQAGCEETNARLRAAGFLPVEIDTDEFLKAGGSVFCMKLMCW